MIDLWWQWEPHAIVVMGVSGSGKSTIGPRLAVRFGSTFIEGDDLHTPENIAKMRGGTPLTDDDRWPWLTRIGAMAGKAVRTNGHVVVACSALKKSYRDQIRTHAGCSTLFVLLDADTAELERRISERGDHYMPATLLQSQLALLEAPSTDELAKRFSPAGDLAAVLDDIAAWLRQTVAGAENANQHARLESFGPGND